MRPPITDRAEIAATVTEYNALPAYDKMVNREQAQVAAGNKHGCPIALALLKADTDALSLRGVGEAGSDDNR